MANTMFSILIPSYNRPHFLEKAIQSVLSSTYTDYELIVSDDNSPLAEDIREVGLLYSENEKVHFHYQSINIGEAANRNFLISKAKADWVVIIGDDDMLHSSALSELDRQIRSKCAKVDLFAFGYRVIDENNRTTSERYSPVLIDIRENMPSRLRQVLLMDAFPFWFCHPATFCCKKSVHELIPASSNVGIGDDYWFLITFFTRGYSMQILPEMLFSYRKFSSISASKGLQINQSAAVNASLTSRLMILRRISHDPYLPPYYRNFFNGAYFRNRFLYDPVIDQSPILAETIRALDMDQHHSDELYARFRSFYSHKFIQTLRRIVFYIRLTGWRGIPVLLKLKIRFSSKRH